MCVCASRCEGGRRGAGQRGLHLGPKNKQGLSRTSKGAAGICEPVSVSCVGTRRPRASCLGPALLMGKRKGGSRGCVHFLLHMRHVVGTRETLRCAGASSGTKTHPQKKSRQRGTTTGLRVKGPASQRFGRPTVYIKTPGLLRLCPHKPPVKKS